MPSLPRIHILCRLPAPRKLERSKSRFNLRTIRRSHPNRSPELRYNPVEHALDGRVGRPFVIFSYERLPQGCLLDRRAGNPVQQRLEGFEFFVRQLGSVPVPAV